MKNIIAKSPTFSLIFSEQGLKETEYSLASYCITVDCEDGTLIYNNLSKELLLLSKEEAEVLQDINSFNTPVAEYLKKHWFFVPVGTDTVKLCDQLLSTVKLFEKPRTANTYKSYTIMTTLDCNARCFYCFQKGRVQPTMSADTARSIAEYIINHSDREKEITINWFGGEPLYNKDAIDIICDRLNSEGVKFKSKIITNGYLLDKALLAEAKENWNTQKVQITLDGTEKIYNRTKNYIYKDTNPFETVIANIGDLLNNEIKVIIRLNLGLHNADDLYKLVDFLSEKFGGRENFSVYAHRLFDYDDSGKQVHKQDEIIKTIEIFNSFNDYLAEKGLFSYRKLDNTYTTNRCMADSDNAIVITPEGKLGKCEHFSDKEIIGDIYSEILDKDNISEWKEKQTKLDICDNCAEYINCMRLKKCPDISPQCDIYQRDEKIQTLKKKILNTYNNTKS
ncbi:MAG: 4Fe-4S cluster-binding domain-containing protein [Clostridia bacterium]|nr:4Fe-4S cluster-binding domain-containing protein [Clostridia bacterium]